MSNLKALANLLAKPKRLKALLSYGHKGYLKSIGWFTAFDQQQAVDENGNPLPWVTYSFIDFIKERLNKSQNIFEYGSGSSTLFYADKVATVTSVEHDETWLNKIKNTSPANAEMIYCILATDGEYAKKATLLNKKFEVIIVDGRDRVNCCKYSINALTENGVIVLDDSERLAYEPARKLLTTNGFKELSFSGISPGLFYNKATSVFYKTNNCLGI
ncbi:FkbM family methyltransferase [Pedobacter changchengzhani]|uniref:FkbM family methyltransferase n=1 Tax=Pedobacter changchengzhani TaxID=2529274 RepID=A0A4V3A0D7_9SPHI|nr:FkbM family methyltransferase [Pedobacter changchengzhani]TDG37213.1 FkbM family methyltransferase [Pedobacter changchengzhani]